LGVRTLCCDLTETGTASRIASLVRGELGGLDILINNAGVQLEHDLDSALDLDAVNHEMRVNLLAPIALTHALLPTLSAAGEGVVANVTSALAFTPAARAPIYAATKS